MAQRGEEMAQTGSEEDRSRQEKGVDWGWWEVLRESRTRKRWGRWVMERENTEVESRSVNRKKTQETGGESRVWSSLFALRGVRESCKQFQILNLKQSEVRDPDEQQRQRQRQKAQSPRGSTRKGGSKNSPGSNIRKAMTYNLSKGAGSGHARQKSGSESDFSMQTI